MLPENLLHEKIAAARQFLRVAQERIPQLIPGCSVEVADAQLDDFIRDNTTHELFPPQAADDATQAWITDNFRVGEIQCENCIHPISCPICWHERFLRGWLVRDHTLALCYNCGAVFYCDNGQVLEEFAGNRENWGAQGIALAATLKA